MLWLLFCLPDIVIFMVIENAIVQINFLCNYNILLGFDFSSASIQFTIPQLIIWNARYMCSRIFKYGILRILRQYCEKNIYIYLKTKSLNSDTPWEGKSLHSEDTSWGTLTPMIPPSPLASSDAFFSKSRETHISMPHVTSMPPPNIY